MNITFYGTRGSIATANKEVQKYGGNTTCLYIESNSGDAIIVDAGTGIRKAGLYLLENKKSKIHLLFTHYHWDHIQGFPFFAPLFVKNTVIDVYGPNEKVTVEEALAYQMTRPYFPASLADLPANMKFRGLGNNIKIGEIIIQTIVNNHPDYTLGLKFTEGEKTFVFLTDNELFAKDGPTPYAKFVDFVKGADVFMHDAQYTDELYEKRVGWGHSTYTQLMQLADDSGVKNVIFTHHDHSSTDKFIDAKLKEMKSKHRGTNIQAAADGKTIILK